MLTMCGVLLCVLFPVVITDNILDLTNRVDRLEKLVVQVSTENEVLRQRLDETEKENAELRVRVAALEEEKGPSSSNRSGVERRQIETTVSKGVELGGTLDVRVAFHANIRGNMGLSDNEIIRFEQINLNLGSAYDANLGLFQCKLPGYYVFFVHFLVLSQKLLEAHIVKDGSVIQNIFAGTQDVGNGPGSNLVIVHMNRGERVWVRVHDHYHGTGDTLDGPWCTFAGFLLYADSYGV